MERVIKYKNNQLGYTIIEILIGSIVATLVAVSIYSGWNILYSLNQSTKILSEITTIVQNTETLYSTSADGYASLTMTDAIAAGVFPKPLLVEASNNSVNNNPYGPVKLLSSKQGYFRVQYEQLPIDVCIKVLSNISASVNIDKLLNISTTATANLWVSPAQLPSISAIKTACTQKSGDVGVAITFNFI